MDLTPFIAPQHQPQTTRVISFESSAIDREKLNESIAVLRQRIEEAFTVVRTCLTPGSLDKSFSTSNVPVDHDLFDLHISAGGGKDSYPVDPMTHFGETIDAWLLDLKGLSPTPHRLEGIQRYRSS